MCLDLNLRIVVPVVFVKDDAPYISDANLLVGAFNNLTVLAIDDRRDLMRTSEELDAFCGDAVQP